MRAAWYERTGPAREVLTVGEREAPQPGPGEVRVRVHTSGVNPSDVKSRGGFRGRPMPFPLIIPHSDGAGVIDAVGDGVPAGRVGERVWTWNAAFGRPDGTAAEYVALPSAQAVRLPDSTDFAAGACLGIPALTAHRCLFSDGSITGQTVLVAGGAGA
ncbi:MAG: alcohol dehydrogenase catalytic domain-containing protein, partial [Chloroflexi bacterium]|nr:alcohol dehydrogenase catalytic domain-containing protein [Chloroflexota bacterium]